MEAAVQADSQDRDPVEDQPQAAAANSDQGAPQSAAEAVEVLERTLGHFESVIGTLEERAERAAAAPVDFAAFREELSGIVHRMDEALTRLGSEAQRLSDEASVLAHVSGSLQERLIEVADAVSAGALAPVAEDTAAPPAQQEPQFWLGDQPLGIVIVAIPGFQGLMDVQRGMSELPLVEGASVVGYKNGEASLEVTLREPITAREIVEGLLESTGHQLVIEEARPDALRLRLRFAEPA